MGEAIWTKAQRDALATLPREPRAGDLWKVGPHTLIVGSMEDASVVGMLLDVADRDLDGWDLCWTDPPWDATIGRTFRRQAGLDGDANLEACFENLGWALARVTTAASIWTGKPAEDLSQLALMRGGFTNLLRVEVTYVGAKSATPVWVGDHDHGLAEPAQSTSYRIGVAILGSPHGRAQANAFLDALGNAVPNGGWHLVDPFCGQEVMASLASREDIASLTGVELHPGRAARTIAALSKASGNAVPNAFR